MEGTSTQEISGPHCVRGEASIVVLLAAIRNDLLAEQIKASTSVVVIDGTPAESSQTENNFYEKATQLLQLVMIFWHSPWSQGPVLPCMRFGG